MFSIPAYAGYNAIKKKGEPIKYIKAQWKGIITLDEYKDMQQLIELEKKERKDTWLNMQDFWLKNALFCNATGKRMTGSWSQGKRKKYAYYHPAGHKGQRIPNQKAHDIVIASLVKLDFNDILFEEGRVNRIVKEVTKEHLGDINEKIAGKQSALDQMERRIKRMLDMFIDGDLNKQEYEQNKKIKSNEIAKIAIELQELKKSKERLNFDAVKLRKKAPEIFKRFKYLDCFEKTKYLRVLFPQGFRITADGKMAGLFNQTLLHFLLPSSMNHIVCEEIQKCSQQRKIIQHHSELLTLIA